MKTLKLALAGLVTAGAALVAAPEPAKAFYGYGYGYGHYRPIHYRPYGYYHRPFVKRVVVVQRPFYQPYGYGYGYYNRPFVKKVVVVRRPFYYGY